MRELTGRWTLEKNWLGRYKILVEVKVRDECEHTILLGPEYIKWEEAETSDIVNLKIPVS